MTSYDPFEAYSAVELKLLAFDPISKTWESCILLEVDPSRSIWAVAEWVQGIPNGTVFLCQIQRTNEEVFNFLTRLEVFESRIRFEYPTRFFPVTGANTENQRKNFRVTPGLTDEVEVSYLVDEVSYQADNRESPVLKSRLLDVSAGGLGIVVTSEDLQNIGTHPQFLFFLNLNEGLIGKEGTEDIIEVKASPINVFSRQDGRYKIGFQFLKDETGNSDDEQRLLHYVAARQRQLLRRISRSETGKKKDS